MKKKVLVTGGAGFIGSYLSEKLIKKGYKVIAYDNLFSGSINNIQNLLKNKNFEFVKADIRQKRALEKQVRKVDEIYHLAAMLGVSKVIEEPLLSLSVNVKGIENICELSHKYGNIRVIFTSSSEVYGKNPDKPLMEDCDLVFGSSQVVRWSYGLSKALGEQMLYAYSGVGLPFLITRIFNSYGPRGINKAYSHVIPKFLLNALKNEPLTVFGDGTQSRTFCFVEDTVEGILKTSEKLKNQVVNIGSDNETKIVDLAKLIIKMTRSKSNITFVKDTSVYGSNFEAAKIRVPDTRKAKTAGFTAHTSLIEGLKKTIEWTQESIKH